MDRTVTPEPYQPSWRRTAGALLILLLIILWASLVIQLSGPVSRLPTLVQTLFYLFAGLAWIWVLPMRRILQWSETGQWRR